MAAVSMSSPGEFYDVINHFKRNALLIIDEIFTLGGGHHTVLMDEVLHSIFFLAKINKPSFTPEEIVTDDDILNELKGRYPGPFKHYFDQLPRRSPISCVLDMIVFLKGPENEEAVIETLRELICQLKKDGATELVSSTICVSEGGKTRSNSKRYYGVSMSTSGPIPGRIMIAASCLSAWDSYVAGAVMTFYPSKKEKVKKDYFDGTFKLPERVRCEAFKISDRSLMPPCKSCGNMFGLRTSETKGWPYGNCAECECLSNLLKNEQKVRENVRPVSDANRPTAEESVRRELGRLLRLVHFTKNKDYKPSFYIPQLV